MRFAGQNFSTFKEALSALSVEVLGQIGGEMRRLMADPGHIDAILRRGAEHAAAIAMPVLDEVKDIQGCCARELIADSGGSFLPLSPDAGPALNLLLRPQATSLLLDREAAAQL